MLKFALMVLLWMMLLTKAGRQWQDVARCRWVGLIGLIGLDSVFAQSLPEAYPRSALVPPQCGDAPVPQQVQDVSSECLTLML